MKKTFISVAITVALAITMSVSVFAADPITFEKFEPDYSNSDFYSYHNNEPITFDSFVSDFKQKDYMDSNNVITYVDIDLNTCISNAENGGFISIYTGDYVYYPDYIIFTPDRETAVVLPFSPREINIISSVKINDTYYCTASKSANFIFSKDLINWYHLPEESVPDNGVKVDDDYFLIKHREYFLSTDLDKIYLRIEYCIMNAATDDGWYEKIVYYEPESDDFLKWKEASVTEDDIVILMSNYERLASGELQIIPSLPNTSSAATAQPKDTASITPTDNTTASDTKSSDTKTTATELKIIDTKTVAAEALNVRSSASANSKIVAHYVKGDTAYIIGSEGKWLQVTFSGNTGYIDSRYVE